MKIEGHRRYPAISPHVSPGTIAGVERSEVGGGRITVTGGKRNAILLRLVLVAAASASHVDFDSTAGGAVAEKTDEHARAGGTKAASLIQLFDCQPAAVCPVPIAPSPSKPIVFLPPRPAVSASGDVLA